MVRQEKQHRRVAAVQRGDALYLPPSNFPTWNKSRLKLMSVGVLTPPPPLGSDPGTRISVDFLRLLETPVGRWCLTAADGAPRPLMAPPGPARGGWLWGRLVVGAAGCGGGWKCGSVSLCWWVASASPPLLHYMVSPPLFFRVYFHTPFLNLIYFHDNLILFFNLEFWFFFYIYNFLFAC